MPTTGNYCIIPAGVVENYAGKSMQKVMRLPKYKPCTVCAIGSLLLGYVDKHNQLKVPNANIFGYGHYYDDVAVKKLKGVFAEHQLRYMERAFEGREIVSTDLSSVEIDAATKFHARHFSPTKRLKAILNNVIENKGKFVLPLEEE